MKLAITPGVYVVAVSGGVDSMALLHMLQVQPGVVLAVAHFDHGVRADSVEDRLLVEQVTQSYGLPFIYEQGHLGGGASEATAREARYAFLRRVQKEQGAQGIITAHHQDDVLETIFINLTRGTGRRGLSSLQSTPELVRPLLNIPKAQLIAYAQEHQLQWREDSTNQDDRYLRNYLRHNVIPRMTTAQRTALLQQAQDTRKLNQTIEFLLAPAVISAELPRHWFIMLPHDVSREVMAAWLRRHGAGFDRAAIERLTVFAKTAHLGKRADVDGRHSIRTGKEHITLLAKSSNL